MADNTLDLIQKALKDKKISQQQADYMSRVVSSGLSSEKKKELATILANTPKKESIPMMDPNETYSGVPYSPSPQTTGTPPVNPPLARTDVIRLQSASDRQLAGIPVNPPMPEDPRNLNPPASATSSNQSAQTKPSPSPTSGGSSVGGGSIGISPVDANRKFEAATMKNLDEQEANIQERARIEQDQAQKEALQITVNNQLLADRNAQIQEDHERRVQFAQSKWNELNQKSNDLANYKEDPERFWSSRTSAQKNMAIIGMILGAFGTRNGVNPGVQALNQNIDRDIASQRATYQAKRDSVVAQSSAFGQLMSLYHDEDSAALALRTLQVDEASRKLQALAASSKSQIVAQNAKAALTALSQQRNQLEYQFQMQQYDMAAKIAAAQAMAQSSTSGIEGIPQVPTDQFVPIGEVGKDGIKRGLAFGSAKEAEEYRKAEEAAVKSKAAISQLEAWNGLSAAEKIDPRNRAMMNQARTMLQQNYGHAVSGTASSDKEQERLAGTIENAVSNTARIPGLAGAEDSMKILKEQLLIAEQTRANKGSPAAQTVRLVTDPNNRGKKMMVPTVIITNRPQETTSAQLPPPPARKPSK